MNLSLLEGQAKHAVPIVRGGFCGFVKSSSPSFNRLNTCRGEFAVHNVRGDGKCLFRAIAYLVLGNEESYPSIMHLAADHIKSDWIAFEAVVQAAHGDHGDVSTAAAYVQFITAPTTYGTVAELCAISVVLQRKIYVFNEAGNLVMDSNAMAWLIGTVFQERDLALLLSGSMSSGHYQALSRLEASTNSYSSNVVDGSNVDDDISSRTPCRRGTIDICGSGFQITVWPTDNQSVSINLQSGEQHAVQVWLQLNYLLGRTHAPSDAIQLPLWVLDEVATHTIGQYHNGDDVIVWRPYEHPLITQNTTGLHLCQAMGLALYNDADRATDIQQRLGRQGPLETCNNMYNNSFMDQNSLLLEIAMEYNIEIYYYQKLQPGFTDNEQPVPNKQVWSPCDAENLLQKVCLLHDAHKQGWYVLAPVNSHSAEPASPYDEIEVCSVPVDADVIDEAREHPAFKWTNNNVVVHMPFKRQIICLGTYSEVEEAILVHDLAFMMLNKRPTPRRKMLIPRVQYWQSDCTWAIPDTAMQVLNRVVQRPFCVQYSMGDIIWPEASELVLITALTGSPAVPVGKNNGTLRRGITLLQSVAYIMTMDAMALDTWCERPSVRDVDYVEAVKIIADKFNLNIKVYAADGSVLTNVRSDHGADNTRTVYILQCANTCTFLPLIPLDLITLPDITGPAMQSVPDDRHQTASVGSNMPATADDHQPLVQAGGATAPTIQHKDFLQCGNGLQVVLPYKSKLLSLGIYASEEAGVRAHDLALLLTRRPKKQALLHGLVQPAENYWVQRGWQLTPQCYSAINAAVSRPCLIYSKDGAVLWPEGSTIILRTAAVHMASCSKPVSIGKLMCKRDTSLLSSLAYLLLGSLSRGNSLVPSETVDACTMQKLADEYAMSLTIYSRDGRLAHIPELPTNPLVPLSCTAEIRPQRQLSILHHVGNSSYFEPLLPVTISAHSAYMETVTHSESPRQVVSEAFHGSPGTTDNLDDDVSKAVKRPRTDTGQAHVKKRHQQPPEHGLITTLVLGRSLHEFLDVAPEPQAARLRDIAIIISKKRRHGLNHALHTYIPSCKPFTIPSVVYDAVHAHIKRPFSTSISKGWIIWPADCCEVYHAQLVTEDNFTFLRALSVCTFGSENQFEAIVELVIAEINARLPDYRRLLEGMEGTRECYPKPAWNGLAALENNLAEYSKLISIDSYDGFNVVELLAASHALGISIMVHDVAGQETFTTRNYSTWNDAALPIVRLLYTQRSSHWQWGSMTAVQVVPGNEWLQQNLLANCIEQTPDESSAGFWCPRNENNLAALQNYLDEIHNFTKQERSAAAKFWQAKQDQLRYICFVCHRLFFEKQVMPSSMTRRRFDRIQQPYAAMPSRDGHEWVCHSCMKSVACGSIPMYAVQRGYQMNAVPEPLQGLTYLETRLVAANTPFMSISTKRGFQKVMKGGIVNVPNDLTQVARRLPTETNAEATILVHFMRTMRATCAYRSESVRPAKVLAALTWLTQNTMLWAQWRHTLQPMQQHVSNLPGSSSASDSDVDSLHADSSSCSSDSEGEAAAVIQGRTKPRVKQRRGLEQAQHTLIDSQHQLLLCFEREMKIAPAAGSSPLAIFQDVHAEEKAFPVLFGGHARNIIHMDVPDAHYSRIVAWELNHHDRRFATNTENIFFKLFKLRIGSVARLALFKIKQGKLPHQLTQKQALDRNYLQDIASKDIGFQHFRNIRGSPGYCNHMRQEAWAMLRQLGKPAWFFTLSAADTQWPEMQSMLHELRHGSALTPEEVASSSYIQRCKLVSEDPVAAVRYWHMRCMAFIRDVFVGLPAVLGGAQDFFLRQEAQNRGSIHCHGMAYVAGAPEWMPDDPSTLEAVCTFIDHHITCSATAVPEAVLQVQIHSHNRHCLRAHGRCKANFPRPPMPATTILQPLDKDTLQEADVLRYRIHYKRIQSALNDLVSEMRVKRDEYRLRCSVPSYEAFLCQLNMSDRDYKTAIAFSLDRPTVFLRRKPNEILINNYNPIALCLWRANMDLQYVVNAYAAANYVTNYMTKADRTTSMLMDSMLSTTALKPNVQVPDIIRAVGNAFINAQELGAQEVCYLLLGLPLKVASRQAKFIATNRKEHRVGVLRQTPELHALHAESTDVMAPSPIDHYSARPNSMEHVCLADFIACYDLHHRNQPAEINPLLAADADTPEVLPSSAASDVCNLPAHAGKYRRRKAAKILYWHPYSEADPEYCRYMLMLFYPWRDEQAQLLSPTADLWHKFQQAEVHNQVMTNWHRYNKIADMPALIQRAEEEANQFADDEELPADQSHAAPRVFQAVQLHDNSTQALEHVHEHVSYDLLDDIQATSQPSNTVTASVTQLANNIISQEACHAMISSLNREQRSLHDHVLYLMKQSAEPWYIFVSGGAGVGKSHLLRAVEQSIRHWHLRQAGQDFTRTPVVVMAPTGTAAFQVGGLTIHTSLAVPPNTDLEDFEFLSFERINTLRNAWQNVRLLIIDEISMVGNRMLHTINLRLQQVRGTSTPFGGLPVLVFGDLYQLRPVMDGWIFEALQNRLAALAPSVWRQFSLYELHTVMRQRDQIFIERLNRLRVNQSTPEDLAWFRSRDIAGQPLLDVPGTALLFCTNKQVDAFNIEYLANTLGEATTIPAIDSIINHAAAQDTKKIMHRVGKIPTNRTSGLATEVVIKMNIPIELTYNIDITDGLTNGVTGILCNWSLTAHNDVATLYIHFENNKCGVKARAANSSQVAKLGIAHMWTPIQRQTIQFKLSKVSTTTIQRQQFPVRMCAARTVHRVQGQSLQSAVIDLHGRRQPALHYVAMSRITNPNGLAVANFDASAIAVSEQVRLEYTRLREQHNLQLALPTLKQTPPRGCTLIAQNVRSLHSNINNVRGTHDFTGANLLLISETWANASDDDEHYKLPGFDMHRYDNSSTTFNSRPHRGMIAYNQSSKFDVVHATQHASCDILAGQLVTSYLALNIISVYKSPQYSITMFLPMLEAALQAMPTAHPTVIIGDFNIDIKGMSTTAALKLALSEPNHHLRCLAQFMLQRQMSQQLQASTVDSGMQVDHIWTDLPQRLPHFTLLPFVLETFYSDHRPIGLHIVATAS